MQYSLEEFLAMAENYPLLFNELGISTGSPLHRKHMDEPGIMGAYVLVPILSDWEYREEGEILIAESKFTVNGKPACIFETGHEKCSAKVTVLDENGRELPACNAESISEIYMKMGNNPNLNFPEWDKESESLYKLIKAHGQLENYQSDFLLHYRHNGLTGGYEGLLLLVRENGTHGLRNVNTRENEEKISHLVRHCTNEGLVYFRNGKPIYEILPEDRAEREKLVFKILKKLPAETGTLKLDYTLANTEDGSLRCFFDRKNDYWHLVEAEDISDKPYARVEHDNIVGRKESPKP